MSRHVPGKGPYNAEIVVVAEAPGKWEEIYGEPLVGPSGKRWEEWLSEAGLDRRAIRIENVCEYRPPNNQASAWDEATWKQWMEDLHERLANLEDPWIVVPMGNYALYALTGKGSVPWHNRDGRAVRPGILSWRGSILSYRDRRGREIKCVPTPHPASTFRQPELEAMCRRDWARIAEEATFREIATPRREHIIAPTLDDIRQFEREVHALSDGDCLGVDIENPPVEKEKGPWPIVCVGFSYHPEYSITIPTTKSYWKDPKVLEDVWGRVRSLCEFNIAKTVHNWFHEAYWLWEEQGIELRNAWWDTMYMHHALDPSAPHGLDDCASLDTRQPFWKSMAKDTTGKGLFTSNLAVFHEYNGIDVCVGRELKDVYYDRLVNQERETSEGTINGVDYYLTNYYDLFEPLMRLMRHGVRVDNGLRERRYAELRARVGEIRGKLKAIVGKDLYGKKSISGKKLMAYLYEDLKLPVQTQKRKPGVKTPTCNEVAIRKLMGKFPVLHEAGGLILEHRRVDVLSKFYQESRVDADGRFRSSYGLNTEAGRLNSKASPKNTGSNAQNVDREARDIFLADEGCIGVSVDLSQAEARVVFVLLYVLTGEKDYLWKARARPDEYDQHTENAVLIFGKPADQITKDERYLGKKTVHGAQRDLHGKKLSEELLKDGYTYTEQECQKMLDAYHRRVPALKRDYFKWVELQINGQRYLENSWGHRLFFTYDRLDADTYRRGYSYFPQSDVGMLMNRQGFVPMDERLRHGDIGKINVQCHDELFMSLRPEVAYDGTKFLVESLETPRKYYGVELAMPCGVEIGLSWKGSVEWKRMPSRREFEEAMRRILYAKNGNH